MSEDIIRGIVEELGVKFDLMAEIEGQYIKINEFDGYVKDNDTYKKMEGEGTLVRYSKKSGEEI